MSLDLQSCLGFTELILESEKRRAIGRDKKADSGPPDLFLLDGDEAWYVHHSLADSPHPKLDARARLGIALRVMTMALSPSAAVCVMQAYGLDCCGTCGSKDLAPDAMCRQCKKRADSTKPRDSKFRQEIICGTLCLSGQSKVGYAWSYKVRYDQQNRIEGFETATKREEIQLSGMFANPWQLFEDQTPHIFANLPEVARLVGKPLERSKEEAIQIALGQRPSGYRLWRMPGVHPNKLRRPKDSFN